MSYGQNTNDNTEFNRRGGNFDNNTAGGTGVGHQAGLDQSIDTASGQMHGYGSSTMNPDPMSAFGKHTTSVRDNTSSGHGDRTGQTGDYGTSTNADRNLGQSHAAGELDSSNRGTGFDSSNRGTGFDSSNSGTGFDSSNSGTGFDSSNSGTGFDSSNRGTGFDPSNRGTGFDDSNRGTGAGEYSSTTQGTGYGSSTHGSSTHGPSTHGTDFDSNNKGTHTSAGLGASDYSSSNTGRMGTHDSSGNDYSSSTTGRTTGASDYSSSNTGGGQGMYSEGRDTTTGIGHKDHTTGAGAGTYARDTNETRSGVTGTGNHGASGTHGTTGTHGAAGTHGTTGTHGSHDISGNQNEFGKTGASKIGGDQAQRTAGATGKHTNVEHVGKPSTTDKIIGGIEKAAGKATSNAGLVTKGEERATGERHTTQLN